MTTPVTGAPRPPRPPGPIRRLLGWLADQLPAPPDDESSSDPLLEGLEELPPEEREARLAVWRGKFRRGRGDGNG